MTTRDDLLAVLEEHENCDSQFEGDIVRWSCGRTTRHVGAESWAAVKRAHLADVLWPTIRQSQEVLRQVGTLPTQWMRNEDRGAEYQDGRADCAEELDDVLRAAEEERYEESTGRRSTE